jgi:hypothetical protein
MLGPATLLWALPFSGEFLTSLRFGIGREAAKFWEASV